MSTFDFKKMATIQKETPIIDPIEIFQKKLKITDNTINDLWLGQGDALRDWHNNREKEDIAIVLNTGAGKTLVGLLIAQSLLNELKGNVLYLCGSIQLIEQTKEKALSCGIAVSSYYQQNFNNEDLFIQNKAFCITTYQAVFNGKSIFKNKDIKAIVFDDAHVAENMIKNSFSFEIRKDLNSDLYFQLANLFKPYYQKIGKSVSFHEICEEKSSTIELLPPTVVQKNKTEIYRLINDSDIFLKNKSNIFPWEYLKDHLDLCAYFISNDNLLLIPPFIPIFVLPYFKKHIKRIYLTATMVGEDVFIRTFGKLPEYIVQPITPAGQCERLFLFPQYVSDASSQVEITKEIIAPHKALILTSNHHKSQDWKNVAMIPPPQMVAEAVKNFKNEKEKPQKLVLEGRYDGVDLPGDVCRYLVLHGLPSGLNLFDHYFWSSLRIENVLRSMIACRVTQSFGRITRGMNDYGVVAVIDKKYVNWLMTPKNLNVLPEFIQKQIQLGFELAQNLNDFSQLQDLSNKCLLRDNEWLNYYQKFMNEYRKEQSEPRLKSDMDLLKNFASEEIKFSTFYWERNFSEAAKTLEKIINNAYKVSEGLGAWYSLWVGYCYELLSDPLHENLYRRAYGASKAIPKYINIDDITILEDNFCNEQISNIINEVMYQKQVKLPSYFHNAFIHLNGNSSAPEVEESLRCLGQFLGLNSTRPEKECGKGPDVLWLNNGIALAIEAKSGKEEKNKYYKHDVGQLNQHSQWVKDQYSPKKIIPIFVGPTRAAEYQASPSDDMMVANLSKFKNISDKVMTAYQDLVNCASTTTVFKEATRIFTERKLLFSDIIEQLNLINLKSL